MVKVRIIQNKPSIEKISNIYDIFCSIKDDDFDILVFPEFFNSPYGIKYFKEYAEELSEGNTTYDALQIKSEILENKYIVAGSIPEKDGDKYYNTCSVWLNGEIICKYRKINLFDIDIKKCGLKFSESSVLSPGLEPAMFDTQWGKIGLGICFDLRFNQLSNYYAKNGCFMIIYPGCFTQYTGDLHWELLLRARAVDSRCYIVGCSTATNYDMEYKSYGHSMIVSPMGEVLSKLDDKEDIIDKDIYPSKSEYMKESIPENHIIYL